MKIPEELIQQIREASDIIEVVSQYVGLKKKGKTFMGLCPFHTEKSPSFSVDPVRGFYHCFGCGEGGNVFTFMMQMEKVGFPEAVRTLAEKAGIPLPEPTEEDSKEARESELLYHVNEFAHEFFKKCLFNTDAGKKALAYLESRQFEKTTIEEFSLGYAPQRWDGLIRMAEKEHFSIQKLAKSGLVVPKKTSGYYDRFRGRLIFPIMSPSGRIVGFGGRALKEEANVPKYINSPESPIYRKSQILYGIYQSASGIRQMDRVLLVEGYTDVLRLYQSGFQYCVASSGTAFTEEQARLLSRYTKRVVLVFDGDSAGLQAALRGVDVLIAQGLHVEVAPLPGGADPDSIIQEGGQEAMSRILENTRTFIDFRLERIRVSGRLKTPADRAEAARSILETISAMKDRLERALTVKDLAEKLGIDESLLRRSLEDARDETSETPVEEKAGATQRETAEEELLLLILENPRRWGVAIFQEFDPKRFQGSEARWLATFLYEEILSGREPGPRDVLDRCKDHKNRSRFVARLLSRRIEDGVNRGQWGLDCLLSLKTLEMQEEIRVVKEKIRHAEQEGEDVSTHAGTYLEIRRKVESERKRLAEAWKKDVEF